MEATVTIFDLPEECFHAIVKCLPCPDLLHLLMVSKSMVNFISGLRSLSVDFTSSHWFKPDQQMNIACRLPMLSGVRFHSFMGGWSNTQLMQVARRCNRIAYLEISSYEDLDIRKKATPTNLDTLDGRIGQYLPALRVLKIYAVDRVVFLEKLVASCPRLAVFDVRLSVDAKAKTTIHDVAGDSPLSTIAGNFIQYGGPLVQLVPMLTSVKSLWLSCGTGSYTSDEFVSILTKTCGHSLTTLSLQIHLSHAQADALFLGLPALRTFHLRKDLYYDRASSLTLKANTPLRGIGKLRNLSIRCFAYEHDEVEFLREAVNLRYLELQQPAQIHVRLDLRYNLLDMLSAMGKNLVSLKVLDINFQAVHLDYWRDAEICPNLTELYLGLDKFELLPYMHCFPNITSLDVRMRSWGYPAPHQFGQFPKLEELHIEEWQYRAGCIDNVHFSKNDLCDPTFLPNLKRLSLHVQGSRYLDEFVQTLKHTAGARKIERLSIRYPDILLVEHTIVN